MNQKNYPDRPSIALALVAHAGTIEADRIEAGVIPDEDGELARLAEETAKLLADPNRPNEGDEFSCCPYHREGGELAECGFVASVGQDGKPIRE